MKPVREVVSMIGETRGRQPERAFGIRQRDRLYHTYLIGQTGTGKTTLMGRMIRDDLQKGQGLCLLDPHGDLAHSIAHPASEKILYWNVGDPACPYGYNPLTYVAEQYRPLVASGLIDTLRKQWSDAWGARMEHLLRYALLALLSRRGSTLQDVIPLFLSEDFRKEVIASITDEQVRWFWTVEFAKLNYKTSVDGVAPIANKLGAFLANPSIRRTVCTPKQPLRFREIMDEGKCLIINLSKGRLGADAANILGGLIVSSFALAAYSRQRQPEQERRPFMLYVDEFHAFTTSAFSDMLSELRKYRLGLVLSHQYTKQLESGVLDALIGNAGTIIVFRLGATDAALFAKQLASDVPTPTDLVNLPNYRMYVRLMIDGRQSRAFSAGDKKRHPK